MRTLITGATGLIGRALVSRVGSAVVLSRHPEQAAQRLGSVEAYAWSAEAGPPPVAALRGVDTVFNLAGEPVAEGRWSADRKRRIRDSRVLGTRHLVAGLAAADPKPKVLVSASAVGFYGDRGDEVLDEASPRGSGFLADVCVEWEREALAAQKLGVRVVSVRIGIVLAAEGGALEKMLPLFRLGVGGRMGNGRQWMPWIHVDDVVGILLHASSTATLSGAVNAVGPRPATNNEFTGALGRAVRRPAVLPVPSLALRLALGEMGGVVTGSQRVVPRSAERSGYVFKYPDLAGALAACVR
jgi:uncharacterized protein (TIGR01777 family)